MPSGRYSNNDKVTNPDNIIIVSYGFFFKTVFTVYFRNTRFPIEHDNIHIKMTFTF